MDNPLLEARRSGQSIWFDNIRRTLISSGELERMVSEEALAGVTSNPAIFQKALSGSSDYDDALFERVSTDSLDAKGLYEKLAITDIQMAADVLRRVYERSNAIDGFVSFEVSPYLANDTQGTIEEGRRLFKAVSRDNVMIKVPATSAGIPAIEQLIRDGIPVNVTLLFSVEMYKKAHAAYVRGITARLEAGEEVAHIASVASFFLSRIDSLLDQQINSVLEATQDEEHRAQLKSLLGQIAINNAQVAYAYFLETLDSPNWQALAKRGAQAQRLLWASTSTKNPEYSDTLYVDRLIAPQTVNTIPADTYLAFKDHGDGGSSFTSQWNDTIQQAEQNMTSLAKLNISIDQATDQLLTEGVAQFSAAFDTLLGDVEKKRRAFLADRVSNQTLSLGSYDDAVEASLEAWRVAGNVRRLWEIDASLWTSEDEDRWLGWLNLVGEQRKHLDEIEEVARQVREEGFEHVVVLGMGGSSMCPEVMAKTFGHFVGSPQLDILDSTVPGQVRALANKLNLEKTLFVVASKSGGTTEPNAFKQFFFDEVQKKTGASNVGRQFIAITDPGSSLSEIATRDHFRHIFSGVASVGGRYSALSSFGMVPAALMGVNVREFLDRTEVMVHSCAAPVPPHANPGVALGTAMGVLAQQGHDKLTLIASPSIAPLGAWLEQLVAESLGKLGQGVVPIDGENIGEPSVYGNDRFFVYLRLEAQPDAVQDAAVAKLLAAGHPVARISVREVADLGQEFFRWEIATAVAGSIMGLNTFNQPDVEASKVATRQLTESYEQTGKLANESFMAANAHIKLTTDDLNARALQATTNGDSSVEALIQAHINRLSDSDYFAINAYVEMNSKNIELLQAIRHHVRDQKKVATTLGFGPRFLHSTGQLHKGGANNGVFLQLTCDDAEDLPVPGQKWTFGILNRFQAEGDFAVLVERQRRVLRVHLGEDVEAGLEQLQSLILNSLERQTY